MFIVQNDDNKMFILDIKQWYHYVLFGNYIGLFNPIWPHQNTFIHFLQFHLETFTVFYEVCDIKTLGNIIVNPNIYIEQLCILRQKMALDMSVQGVLKLRQLKHAQSLVWDYKPCPGNGSIEFFCNHSVGAFGKNKWTLITSLKR